MITTKGKQKKILKILLIDDDDADAELLLYSLKEKKIESAYCKSLASALERFGEGDFDIVISDYNIPGTSGLEIFQNIRALNPDIPFIIASGALGEELAVDLLRQGITDYVLKDNPEKLPLAVDRAITEYENKQEVKRSLEQLIEMNKLNTQIIETSDQVFYVCRVDEENLSNVGLGYISPQVEQFFNICKNELLNDIDLWINRIHQDDAHLLESRMSELLATKKPAKVTYRLNNPDENNYFWVEDYACPMFNSRGRIYELYGSVKNVTDKIVALRTLQYEKKQSALYQSQLLSSQLNPHFIYNTLNSFQYYILSGEVEESLHNISAFSSLMRQVLENSIYTTISFQEEMDFIHKYIEISKRRLQQPFEFCFVTSPNFEPAGQFIPPMLLQPYIENAFVHGFASATKPCQLVIDIQLEEEFITCNITDNGIGRKRAQETKVRGADKKSSLSVGINQSRIKLLNETSDNYFTVDFFDLTDKQNESAGTLVKVRFKQITEESE